MSSRILDRRIVDAGDGNRCAVGGRRRAPQRYYPYLPPAPQPSSPLVAKQTSPTHNPGNTITDKTLRAIMIDRQLRPIGGITLRPAQKSDKDFLFTLFNETHGFLRQSNQEKDYLDFVIEQQFDLRNNGYQDNNSFLQDLIVDHLGTPIGRVVINFSPVELRICELSLLKAVQNKQIGGDLVKTVQRSAAYAGLPVSLTVANINVGARRFYAGLGFTVADSNPALSLLVWTPEGKAKEAVIG